MSILTSYLATSKVRAVLQRKATDKGFSLIELVVVVAVLAILSAIAIPAFTSINDKARSSAAANTIAALAKECAVKHANGATGAALNYNGFTLDGYNAVATAACPTAGTLQIVSTDPTERPTFTYNVATGAKTCANASVQQCSAAGTW